MLGDMRDPLVFFVINAKGQSGMACTTVMNLFYVQYSLHSKWNDEKVL